MSSDYYNQLAVDDAHPLMPPPERCECGQPVAEGQRRRCVVCGHEGCGHCLRLADVPDADLNDDWVCPDECAEEWRQKLAGAEDGTEFRFWLDSW